MRDGDQPYLKDGQLPSFIFRARFLRLQARVARIVWKGFAPLSLSAMSSCATVPPDRDIAGTSRRRDRSARRRRIEKDNNGRRRDIEDRAGLGGELKLRDAVDHKHVGA